MVPYNIYVRFLFPPLHTTCSVHRNILHIGTQAVLLVPQRILLSHNFDHSLINYSQTHSTRPSVGVRIFGHNNNNNKRTAQGGAGSRSTNEQISANAITSSAVQIESHSEARANARANMGEL
jgi:hypothetical protein